MNGHQRMTAATEGAMPDKRPVMLHNFMLAAREAGYTMEQFRESPQVIADSFIQSVERYGYDGVLVDVDTVTLAGAIGVPVDRPKDAPARCRNGCIPSLDEVKRLERRDVRRYRYAVHWVEGVKLVKEYFKDEVYIRGNCDQAPFSLAAMVRGLENWLMDLVMEPENAVELLEYCTDITCQFIGFMSESGCDMVSNGDSMAGASVISPEMYRSFALPYEKRVVEYAHKQGLKYALHICGDTELILEDMLKTDSDCFELDYKTDIDKIYNCFKQKATLIGNIDPSGVLAHGTAEDVERATHRLLEVYKNSTRLIVNAGCAIPPDTPRENIKAMINIAHSNIPSSDCRRKRRPEVKRPESRG